MHVVVHSLLLVLMSAEHLDQRPGTIRRNIGIENPHIKESSSLYRPKSSISGLAESASRADTGGRCKWCILIFLLLFMLMFMIDLPVLLNVKIQYQQRSG